MEENYHPCPNCKAPLEQHSQKEWKCQFCTQTFTEEEILQDQQKRIEEEQQRQKRIKKDQSRKKICHCPECGAELITDIDTEVCSCIFCGNKIIEEKPLKESFEPWKVIPFRVSREQAVDSLRKMCRKKPFLPGCFKEKAHLESLTGVYVPFWLNDCYANTSVKARGEKSSTWKEGDCTYTKTDRYDLTREGALAYRLLPTDASAQLDDSMMDALEPFDYGDLQEFRSDYLKGFFAQKYDVTQEDCKERIQRRVEESAGEQIRSSCKDFANLDITSERIDLLKINSRHVMMPVWLLRTCYKEGCYLLMINGQTGKMVGDLPLCKGKVLAFTAILAVMLTLLGTIGGIWLC